MIEALSKLELKDKVKERTCGSNFDAVVANDTLVKLEIIAMQDTIKNLPTKFELRCICFIMFCFYCGTNPVVQTFVKSWFS